VALRGVDAVVARHETEAATEEVSERLAPAHRVLLHHRLDLEVAPADRRVARELDGRGELRFQVPDRTRCTSCVADPRQLADAHHVTRARPHRLPCAATPGLARKHESADGFEKWRAYGRSKLANIFSSNELARRLKAAGSRVTGDALHPGNVKTELWSKIGRDNGSGIPVEEGARTSTYLATSSDVQGRSGGYCFQCEPVTTIYDEAKHADEDYVSKSAVRTEISTSREAAEAMWAVASRDIGLDPRS
jgi:hypothetical protein